MSAEDSSGAGDSLRIDKWLWCARFYKTRSLAAQAVNGGHVRVNGARVKPARDLVVGDELAIVRGSERIECTVLALPGRRGPAGEARACYRESDESIAKRESRALEHRALSAVLRQPTAGRPDKKTRRLLRERFRGSRES
ncbi:MAG TPA: RNA-binding S4 domain-containing protein [Gammaproteobacteria bacterium]|nr:RNA-binding S4 domain-containing protein [Gammaproteobacteria bacterium]